MSGIVGILLAAGQSTRFGREDKLLAPLSDGTPLVIAAARPLLAALPRVIAVISPNALELDELLTQNGIETISCPESILGIGASIACGVRASLDADVWVIGLGDMPCVTPGLVGKIVASLDKGKTLVRPQHLGCPGHPVAFSAKYRNELLRLNSDIGGKRILARHAASLSLLPLKTIDSQLDVDTPADLKNK